MTGPRVLSVAGAFDGAALRAARKALGLKQRELADYLGTDRETVSRWEAGKLTIERPETLALAVDGLRARLAPKGTDLVVECGFLADATTDPDWTVSASGQHCDECDAPESHLEKARNVGAYEHLCLNCASRGGILTLRRPLRAKPRAAAQKEPRP